MNEQLLPHQNQQDATTPREALDTSVLNIADLQAAREIMTLRLSEAELKNTFSDQIFDSVSTNLCYLEVDGLQIYEGNITVRTMIALDAVGVNAAEIVTKLNSTDRDDTNPVVATKQLEDGLLTVQVAGNELLYRLKSDGTEATAKRGLKSESIPNLIHQRLEQSPAHQALYEAAQKLKSQDKVPEIFATEPFDYLSDPYGTYAFLSGKGLFNESSFIHQKLREGSTPEDILEEGLANVSSHSVMVTENEETKTFEWSSHSRTVRKQLIIDKITNQATFSASQNAYGAYLEKANQSDARSLPFIETECAQELGDFMDRAGLMFNPSLQAEMINTGDAERYGSIYTQLSREIAKWVDSPRRFKLSELFVPYNPNFTATTFAAGDTKPEWVKYSYETFVSAQHEDIESQVRQAYSSAKKGSQSEPTSVLFTMIDDVLARAIDPDTGVLTDLPVTSNEVQFMNGACFDVAAYYVGAAHDTRYGLHGIKLKEIQENGVRLLEKTHGIHTFLSLDPMTFNGVRIPKGALFSKSEDNNWIFQRLTPFAFDDGKDQMVFGSEMSKMFLNEREVVERIGDVTLRALIQTIR